jgi:hypothetical protein
MWQLDDPKDGFAETIFQHAERLGYRTGDAIVTTWQWVSADELNQYLEYQGVSRELTDLFWGSPSEQHKAIAAAEGKGDE